MNIFNPPKPKTYEILGNPLHCQICQHNEFWQQEAQLNTAMATLFNLDWTNKSANCLICEKCGYIHWFVPK